MMLCMTVGPPAFAQVNNEAYAGLFLFGDFGEICTMCEVIVLCDSDAAEQPREVVPESGSFTLYHLRTRTFWSQISTIWEWFIANFDSESLAQQGHERPVDVYEIDRGRWSGPDTVEAHIALEPPILSFGGHAIDRRTRAWLDASTSEPVGWCERLPLWTALEAVQRHSDTGADR